MSDLLLTLILGLIYFIRVLQYLVFFDVILSWLQLAGIKWRPKFLADIIDPIYKNIRKIIPTSFGPLDFTPIVVIFVLMFAELLLIGISPEIQGMSFSSLK